MNKQLVGFVVLMLLVGLILLIFSAISYEVLLGVLVGLVPSGVLLYAEKQKAEKEERYWLLRNKEACLIEMIDVLVSFAHDKEGDEEIKIKKMSEKIKRLQSPLVAWAPPTVLLEWNKITQMSNNQDSIKTLTRAGERLFRAIRKELGHNDSDLKPGEVWASLIKAGEKQKVFEYCKGDVYK